MIVASGGFRPVHDTSMRPKSGGTVEAAARPPSRVGAVAFRLVPDVSSAAGAVAVSDLLRQRCRSASAEPAPSPPERPRRPARRLFCLWEKVFTTAASALRAEILCLRPAAGGSHTSCGTIRHLSGSRLAQAGSFVGSDDVWDVTRRDTSYALPAAAEQGSLRPTLLRDVARPDGEAAARFVGASPPPPLSHLAASGAGAELSCAIDDRATSS